MILSGTNKMEALGEKIEYYRTNLHLSQEYVATYLELTLDEYCQLERGRSVLTANEAEKLCTLFGVTIENLNEPLINFNFGENENEYDEETINRLLKRFMERSIQRRF